MVKQISISILITVLILFLLFTQISIKDIINLLKNIDPLWTIAGSFFYLLAVFLQALRFRYLIHSKDISILNILRVSILYNLANMILPSKLGELSYPYLLTKISTINITEGLASLIASRVFDLLTILMIFLFALIGFQGIFKIQIFFIILFVLLLVGLIILLFFYMPYILISFWNIFRKLSERMGIKNQNYIQWVQKKLYGMAENFYALRARRIFIPVIVTSISMWEIIFFVFYLFLKGIGIEISFLKVIFGSTIGLISSSLPISVIGNWGTLEAGWAAGFLLLGFPKDKAIATGFSIHIIIVLLLILAGIISWFTLNKRLSPLLK